MSPKNKPEKTADDEVRELRDAAIALIGEVENANRANVSASVCIGAVGRLHRAIVDFDLVTERQK